MAAKGRASLSAGLDIVRKALCKHELAVIQTTHVDQHAGMVMLTTTLAHGSGEFISAAWPVCRTADMVNPKLMGAALTYARRYGCSRWSASRVRMISMRRTVRRSTRPYRTAPH